MYIDSLYTHALTDCIVRGKIKKFYFRIRYVKIFPVQIGSKYHTGLH